MPERKGFADLIEAFTILDKYVEDGRWTGTHCEHDVLTVCGVDPADVSDEDKDKLNELGFHVGYEYGDEAFHSYRWGSC